MIKFFRQIRKSLVMDNKTTKYFKYAVGEIVLVIIGILIALQINNWNENRKTIQKTNNYLRALVTEIDKNVITLSNAIEYVHADIEEAANSLKLLNLPQAINYPDSTLKKAMETRPIYKTILSQSTFDDFINAGILENIEEINLKNSILSINSLIEDCYQNSKKSEDAWDNYQLPYLLQNNNVMANWDSINNVKIYHTNFRIKREAFIQNFDYSNLLTLRMRMNGNYERQLLFTKEEFIKISERIKKHLN